MHLRVNILSWVLISCHIDNANCCWIFVSNNRCFCARMRILLQNTLIWDKLWEYFDNSIHLLRARPEKSYSENWNKRYAFNFNIFYRFQIITVDLLLRFSFVAYGTLKCIPSIIILLQCFGCSLQFRSVNIQTRTNGRRRNFLWILLNNKYISVRIQLTVRHWKCLYVDLQYPLLKHGGPKIKWQVSKKSNQVIYKLLCLPLCLND